MPSMLPCIRLRVRFYVALLLHLGSVSPPPRQSPKQALTAIPSQTSPTRSPFAALQSRSNQSSIPTPLSQPGRPPDIPPTNGRQHSQTFQPHSTRYEYARQLHENVTNTSPLVDSTPSATATSSSNSQTFYPPPFTELAEQCPRDRPMTRKQKYARHYSNPHSREMKGSEGKTRTRFPYDSQGDDSSSEGGVSHKKTLSVENLSSLNRASPQEVSGTRRFLFIKRLFFVLLHFCVRHYSVRTPRGVVGGEGCRLVICCPLKTKSSRISVLRSSRADTHEMM